MSLERVKDAAIHGLNGPYFPSDIDDLNEVLGDGRINWFPASIRGALQGLTGLQEVGERYLFSVPGYGYRWFCSITVVEGPATVVFAIPWNQDWGKKDGSSLDRSAAVYVELPLKEGSHVDSALSRVTAALGVARDQRVAQLQESERNAAQS